MFGVLLVFYISSNKEKNELSIIVAKTQNKECFFFSDTKVSIESNDSTVFGNQKLRLAPEEGSLKIHILQTRMSIAFAGTVSVCEEIIQSLFEEQPNKIPEYLQEELIRKNDYSEFILALVDNDFNPRLFKIDQKKCEEGNSFWIGNKNAFSEFQSFFVESKINGIMEKTSIAFQKMLENTSIPTIGDFMIGCHFNEKYSSFIYIDSFSFTGSLKTIEISANEWTQFANETNEDGAFVISNLISDQIHRPAICLFFEYGNVAFLYFPINKSHRETRPVVIKAQNQNQLQNYVKENFGLNLIGFTFYGRKINYK